MKTSDDVFAAAAAGRRSEMAPVRLELRAFETRLRRDLIAWILIATR